MEDSVTWPAQPASVEEKSLGVGASESKSVSLPDLLGRLDQLIQVLDQQNQMLMSMVGINQQILEELVGRDDGEEPRRDLAGRPLKLG